MEKRFPMKSGPMRLPGQSLEEQMQKTMDEKIMPWCMTTLFVCLLAGLEWLKSLKHLPPMPGLVTFAAAATLVTCVWRLRKHFATVCQLHRGMKGERAVGQSLEKLRADGYDVFHDLPGKGFNVDHALVGPGGVYTVETKTVYKPIRGSTQIEYDGERVMINGFSPDRDPINQAKAQANFVKTLLKDKTGKEFPVRPVVLYPGWFVSKIPPGALVWVLHEKAFVKFIDNEPQRLSTEDICLAADILRRTVSEE